MRKKKKSKKKILNPSSKQVKKTVKSNTRDDSEIEEDSDEECIICTELYSNSQEGDGWVQCKDCKRWAHEQCAGIEENDDGDYSCDLCQEKPMIGSFRKKLYVGI
uniref:PHD-type domain-containing protein n=1 Tax=Photinus pyralis TaxID=7054 RepID=A0A1Y1LS66_PHOPY